MILPPDGRFCMKLFILYFLLSVDVFANLDNFSLSSEKTQ
ncbi:MAG: hypothetical protein Rsou_0290 [Candidatus Ruthia sp. Asou_11_S2]|nr:hypothetical protein [Candidatus Ruthia sp. Asou_11_S2]